jgi:short-subunit dehydrogenase
MPVALVTGASSGLGLEFAKLFAQDKHDLVVVARRRDRLDALTKELAAAHGIKTHVLTADLMEPNAWRTVVDEIGKLGLEIEFLVNNAGFATTGPFTELDAGKEIGEVHVNMTTVAGLSRTFLPQMVKRGHGRVLNVGSTAGFQPGPFMATYYATKAFVNSFSEALWFEFKGTGVTVTVLCPGATATEFSQVAGNDQSRLFRAGAMGAGVVALAGYRGMHAGRRMVVPGARNKLLVATSGMAPKAMQLAVAAAANNNPEAPHQIKA